MWKVSRRDKNISLVKEKLGSKFFNFGISVVVLLYWGNTKHLEIWRLEIVSSSHHIEQNTFIEASYTNNIHTAEKVCCSCYI